MLKYCDECWFYTEEDFAFCPKCSKKLEKLTDTSEADVKKTRAAEGDQAAERLIQGYDKFKKNAREVVRLFFEMSEEEQDAMVEYTKERADDAKRQAEEMFKNRRKKK